MKRYILWISCHHPGWEPNEFDSLEEIARVIETDYISRLPHVITERVEPLQ
jgi:hypothetical protein